MGVAGKDYIESFVPFVVECIRTSADDAISLPCLQKQIKTEFGLDIPFNPLKMILVRAAKHGYINKEHGVFYRNAAKCADNDFRDKQLKVEAIYDAVIKKLIAFAKNEHAIDWTENVAVTALHDFLRNSSLSLLFTLAENGSFSGPPNSSEQCFIVGSFVADAQSRSDKNIIEDIVALVQGNLLANVLYLPDPGKVQQRFIKTRIYLDTSIIAFSAGYAGPICAAPTLELIELLKEHGAELFCFRQTLDELRGILDACVERLRSGSLRDSYGPSMEYFIETGRSASDVELMAARLNEKVRLLGITIEEKPPYEVKYNVDEKGFEAALDAEIHYSKPKARVHDVDCISAIARLRRGRESYFPESSWALFVTSNSVLARVTRKFFQPEVTPGVVALCMTDYALGNLLWLKNPTKAPNLPRKQLLAHAFAAMQPPEHLWKKYLIEVAQLQDEGRISTDDYYLLRYTIAAKAALMDLTQGNDAAFSEGTVQEVLTIAKEKLRADLTETVNKEQESRRAAETQIQIYKEEKAIRLTKLRSNAINLARRIRFGVHIISVIVIIVGICYTFPWRLPQPMNALGRYILSGILLLLLLLSICNQIWGVTLVAILDRLEKRIAQKLTGWFLHLSGLDEDGLVEKSTEQR